MAKTFEVTAPDGHVLEVTGPDDATQEQALAQAQKLYQPKAASAPAADTRASQEQGKPWVSPTNPLYPAAEGIREAAHMVGNQLQGAPQAITGIPSTISNTGSALYDMITGKGTGKAQEMVKGAVQPAATSLQGAGALVAPGTIPAPTEPEFNQAAQGAGANAAGVALTGLAAKIPTAADYLASKLPSKARAGANFNTVMGAAKDVPLDTTEIGNAAMRADELGRTGATVPKVIRDYINKFPADSTLTYETGRDFASNAGALSASEKMAMNSPMGRQVALFAKALKDANRGAAAQAGMGELYDSAMREYALASHFTDAATALKEVVKKYGMKAAIGAGGYAAYKALSDH